MAQRRPGGPTPRLAYLVGALLVALTVGGYFAAAPDGQAKDLRQASATQSEPFGGGQGAG